MSQTGIFMEIFLFNRNVLLLNKNRSAENPENRNGTAAKQQNQVANNPKKHYTGLIYIPVW